MTIIEHAIAGANQGSWTTTADASGNVTDMTYAIFDGNGSQLTLTTYELIDGQLHSDSAARSTMGRKKVESFVSFGKQGPNNPFIGIGLPVSTGTPPFVMGGLPLILDNTQTGAERCVINGLTIIASGATSTHAATISIDAGRSSEIAYNTTIEGAFPFTLTLTSDYNTANSVVYGPATTDISAKTTQTIPTEDSVNFAYNDASGNELAPILPIKWMGKGDFSTVGNTLTDSDHTHASGSDLATEMDASWKILGLIANSGDIRSVEVFDITTIATNVITLASAPSATQTNRAYFGIEPYYVGTITTASSDGQDIIDSNQSWTDTAFTDVIDTANWCAVNLTTGAVFRIMKEASSHVAFSATNLAIDESGGVTVLQKGIRSGLTASDWAVNDVYMVLPIVRATATYTDPGASSGGGSTRIIDHNIIG